MLGVRLEQSALGDKAKGNTPGCCAVALAGVALAAVVEGGAETAGRSCRVHLIDRRTESHDDTKRDVRDTQNGWSAGTCCAVSVARKQTRFPDGSGCTSYASNEP